MVAEDPRIADTNLIAMVLAWNTPFYPLYVLASAGAAMQPGAWLTLPVFLVFLAVPAVTRRYPLAGRVLLVAAGIANTLYCTWLLGEAAGTWLFLLPCAALAPLLFRRTERGPLVIFLALPVAAGLALTGSYSISPFVCMGASCVSLLWLNSISVIILMVFFGMIALRRASIGWRTLR